MPSQCLDNRLVRALRKFSNHEEFSVNKFTPRLSGLEITAMEMETRLLVLTLHYKSLRGMSRIQQIFLTDSSCRCPSTVIGEDEMPHPSIVNVASITRMR